MIYSFKKLYDIVNRGIAKQNILHEPKELYEPIEYTLSNGGKRLRAVLVLMGYNLFKNNVETALLPAIGIELFHNFTLLHDDLMDNSPVRRGKPTVYQKWNPNRAILSGDAMQILAYQYIAQCGTNKLQEILQIFSKTALEVCEGQMYDMNFEGRKEEEMVSVEEYLEMIRLKTAVLLAGSLKIGAVLGGADAKMTDELYHLGQTLGLAFQLQDDFLDVYGNTKHTGKKIGGDIIANKKTYLLIKTFEEIKGTDLSNKLHKSLGNSLEEEKVKEIINIYEKVGIKEMTQKLINKYFKEAIMGINNLQIEETRKTELKNLIEQLQNRKG